MRIDQQEAVAVGIKSLLPAADIGRQLVDDFGEELSIGMDELTVPGGRGDPVGVLAVRGPAWCHVAGVDAVVLFVFGPGSQMALPVGRVAKPASFAHLVARTIADRVGIPRAAPASFALRRPSHSTELRVHHVLAQNVCPVVIHFADERV